MQGRPYSDGAKNCAPALSLLLVLAAFSVPSAIHYQTRQHHHRLHHCYRHHHRRTRFHFFCELGWGFQHLSRVSLWLGLPGLFFVLFSVTRWALMLMMV